MIEKIVVPSSTDSKITLYGASVSGMLSNMGKALSWLTVSITSQLKPPNKEASERIITLLQVGHRGVRLT